MTKYSLCLVALLALSGCQLESSAVESSPKTEESTVTEKEDSSDNSSVIQPEKGKSTPVIQENSQLVYVSAGAIQCDYQGRTTTETAQLLIDAGIDVISSYCGVTDMAYITVCGAATGDINLHEINAANVDDAKEIGFGPVSELVDMGIGYQVRKCKTQTHGSSSHDN
jgi:hypothetical protein